MSEQETGRWIPDGDPVAAGLRLAVHAGDVEAVQRLLRSHPALATARLGSKDSGSATPLHLVADWPGYFPNCWPPAVFTSSSGTWPTGCPMKATSASSQPSGQAADQERG